MPQSFEAIHNDIHDKTNIQPPKRQNSLPVGPGRLYSTPLHFPIRPSRPGDGLVREFPGAESTSTGDPGFFSRTLHPPTRLKSCESGVSSVFSQ
ncbi:unnamed protein product [Cylicostephanus goldi]|uniref:Uncharacterized protein n=1 Tax=Cylicostephanus goldi TaxID=71465 RepID=A0A3P7P565_CYLGO|nr:unnamed protein product [Cylicostephanus goldi]